MRKIEVAAIWGAMVFGFFSGGFAKGAQAPRVHLVEMRSTINPATTLFLKESIRLAEEEGAEALVVELDTPGGLLSSVREMAQSVSSAKVPVVVYVTPAGASATSAGALLMLSSHLAAMAPGTNIGAAHPVGSQGEDIKGTMGEKVLNDTTAFARGLADFHGRNREIAERVVSKSASFTAEEALKQGLIEVVAATREDLIRQLDGRRLKLGASEKKLSTQNFLLTVGQMTVSQKLLNLLANPNVSAILMSLGMLLIYVEITTPGAVFPGILGAIFLIISFMSLQTLPIQLGGLALLILGMVLMLAEPFVTAKGALAAGGVLSFILGLLWVVDPNYSDLTMSWFVLGPLATGLTLGVGLLAWAAARTERLTSETRHRIHGGAHFGLAGYSGLVESIQVGGKTGSVKLRGEIWEFESDQPLQVGDSVKVHRIDGMKVIVKNAGSQKRV